MPELSCQLSFYPDYLHEEMGLDFSERYHTDAVYRHAQLEEVSRWAHGRFGHWGVGTAEPQGSYSVTTLDPVHMISYLFGGEITYSVKDYPAIKEYPLEGLADLRDFTWRSSEIVSRVQQLLDDTRELVGKFGVEKVSIPFYAAKTDIEIAHCPLTIAYRLFGTRLLEQLYDDPEGVKWVFGEIIELLKKLGADFRQVVGIAEPGSAHVGACVAVFIGPEQFREFLIEPIVDYVSGRYFSLHCCGNVNHLFGVFGQLNKKCGIDLFDCREQAGIDLSGVPAVFPGAKISYMLSAAACLDRNPGEIKDAVQRAVKMAGGQPLSLILGLPAGVEDGLVDAFFESCVELGAVYPRDEMVSVG